jgi:hypothetical protein
VTDDEALPSVPKHSSMICLYAPPEFTIDPADHGRFQAHGTGDMRDHACSRFFLKLLRDAHRWWLAALNDPRK